MITIKRRRLFKAQNYNENRTIVRRNAPRIRNHRISEICKHGCIELQKLTQSLVNGKTQQEQNVASVITDFQHSNNVTDIP